MACRRFFARTRRSGPAWPAIPGGNGPRHCRKTRAIQSAVKFRIAMERTASTLHPQPNSPQSYPTRKLSWLIRDCRQWPLPMIASGVRPLRSGNLPRRLPPPVPQATPVPAFMPWLCRPSPLRPVNRRTHPLSPTPSSPSARRSSGRVPLCVPATPMAGRRGPGSSVVAVPVCLGPRGKAFHGKESRIPCGRWRWARTAISPPLQPTETGRRSGRVDFLRECRDRTDPWPLRGFDGAGDRTSRKTLKALHRSHSRRIAFRIFHVRTPIPMEPVSR